MKKMVAMLIIGLFIVGGWHVSATGVSSSKKWWIGAEKINNENGYTYLFKLPGGISKDEHSLNPINNLVIENGVHSLGCLWNDEDKNYEYVVGTVDSDKFFFGKTSSWTEKSFVLEPTTLCTSNYGIEAFSGFLDGVKSIKTQGEPDYYVYNGLIVVNAGDDDQEIYFHNRETGQCELAGNVHDIWGDFIISENERVKAVAIFKRKEGDEYKYYYFVATLDISSTKIRYHRYIIPHTDDLNPVHEFPLGVSIFLMDDLNFIDQDNEFIDAVSVRSTGDENEDTGMLVVKTFIHTSGQQIPERFYYYDMPTAVPEQQQIWLNIRHLNKSPDSKDLHLWGEGRDFDAKIKPRTDLNDSNIAGNWWPMHEKYSDIDNKDYLHIKKKVGKASWRILAYAEKLGFPGPDFHVQSKIGGYLNVANSSKPEKISWSFVIGVDDPCTPSGLCIIPNSIKVPEKISIDDFKDYTPYISSDFSQYRYFQFLWPNLVKLKNSNVILSSIKVSFYELKENEYKLIHEETVEEVNLNTGFLFSYSSEEFSSLFQPGKRYFMQGKVSLNNGDVICSNMDAGFMDWFASSREDAGFVFRTKYGSRPGELGPWSTGHHHVWAETASKKYVIDDNKNKYLIFTKISTFLGHYNEWNEVNSGGIYLYKSEEASEDSNDDVLCFPINSIKINGNETSSHDFFLSDLNFVKYSINGNTKRAIFAIAVVNDPMKSSILKHAVLLKFVIEDKLEASHWEGEQAKDGRMTAMGYLIDKGELFTADYFLDRYGVTPYEGILQAPQGVISVDNEGNPKAFYVALEAGKIQAGSMYSMLNAGKWDPTNETFVFHETCRGDEKWACFGIGVIPMVAMTNYDEENYVHFFRGDSYCSILEGDPDSTELFTLWRMINGVISIETHWTDFRRVFPGAKETVYQRLMEIGYDQYFGDNFTLDNMTEGYVFPNVYVDPETNVPGDTICAVGVVSFGLAAFSHYVIYNELHPSPSGSDDFPYNEWDSCDDYEDFVVQDYVEDGSSPGSWPVRCGATDGARLPKSVDRPYLSFVNDEIVSVFWEEHSYFPDLCNVDGIFHKSMKVAWKSFYRDDSLPYDAQPFILNKDNSLGSFFPVPLLQQPEQLFLEFACVEGDNYDYRGFFNADYKFPDRFNFNNIYTYHLANLCSRRVLIIRNM